MIGASGHAKVIADIAMKSNRTIFGFLDDNVSEVLGIKVLGSLSDVAKYKDDYDFVIAIGSNEFRYNFDCKNKLTYATLVHPSAQIGVDVKIGEGTVVMANAVINPSARIGRHCIINTSAIVEHDNKIGNFVHLSPNTALSGTVEIGERTHIGVGTIVKNNIAICGGCIVGAGCVVVKDIIESGTYVGVPARRIK
ncbi:MAG: acetyltransferase [Oscillospiraceae bacterium]